MSSPSDPSNDEKGKGKDRQGLTILEMVSIVEDC